MKITRCWLLIAACCMALPPAAEAKTVVRDYVVDLQDTDFHPYVPNYITKSDLNSSWTNIQQGDTFTGTIKFSGLSSFQPKYNMNISAQFLFSRNGDAKIWHRGWLTNTPIDAEGNSLGSEYFYVNDTDFYLYASSGRPFYQNLGSKVAGMRFSMQFDALENRSGTDPVMIQLNGITVSNFASVASPVPEPSTWVMMMLGMAGTGLAMRRRLTGSMALA